MKIESNIPSAQTLPSAAERMPQPGKKAGLGKACDQFESMLVRQILENGMKPLLAKPLGTGTAGSGMYDYMVTDTLANSFAGKHGMGISHMLQAQLAPKTHS